ncbi:dTDP-glucose 4,6-dehydratase [Corynebacterium sp. zg254]|uniref:dTDP-glucose 4,6-dehydratase n=1 Tax=Corynebacterium zhongnanshanii TaxID=2768834 RepID=A0ABQ6VG05_9CORY|nr:MULTISPECIES: dTDP-glucose 4,6-dehydratase [Corynebacterium]KAB3522738.1 dTDP-glucose 4,6-dehydratase [Corynebacterium zhongnanshanii]MCR5914203.1 dTDP-glucose 4,6-dehydratase [Corynebacterium sp. zg254]
MRTFRYLLVTGGAGFIGSNFVHRTLETRPDVCVHVLDAMTYAANPDNLILPDAQRARLQFTRGSVVDVETVSRVLSGLVAQAEADGYDASAVAIVHFAAESHNDNSLLDPGLFARTNVEGTVVLAEAAVRFGVHLHHISTDEVFGDLALDDPARFTVETPYAPSSPYSASKAAADHFVRACVRSRGLSATISNCSNNYGPRQHPEKFIPRQITGLLGGEKPRLYGAGDNVRDWIHVDDHNDAVWTILERGEVGQTYLIGADGERSNREVVGDLLALFEKPSDWFVHVTDRPGHDRRYAIDPSSTESLGWSPRYTSFAEGLAATVEWYRSHPGWWGATRAAAEERYSATEKVL